MLILIKVALVSERSSMWKHRPLPEMTTATLPADRRVTEAGCVARGVKGVYPMEEFIPHGKKGVGRPYRSPPVIHQRSVWKGDEGTLGSAAAKVSMKIFYASRNARFDTLRAAPIPGVPHYQVGA